MEGPISKRADSKNFVSSSAYSIECIKRYMKMAEGGELDGAAAKDIVYASKFKYSLRNTTPHFVFNYYADFFWKKPNGRTTISKCRKWVLSHEAKESKKNLSGSYFNHLTNKLIAIGFIYRRKQERYYLIFLENVVRMRGIPWFRRRNQRLIDPEFRPEGGIFNTDDINWCE